MNCPAPVLPQKNFVNVCVEQFFFFEVAFEDDSHDELTKFAGKRSTIVEEIGFHQLLG